MRLARRAVAVVLQLLLLQVSMLGSGAACAGPLLTPSAASVDAPRHAHAARGAAHAAAHHAHADAAGRSDVEAPRSEHDRAPDYGPHDMTHCALSTACATIALAAPASNLPEPASHAGRVPAGDADAPRSEATPPEPPPPRA